MAKERAFVARESGVVLLSTIMNKGCYLWLPFQIVNLSFPSFSRKKVNESGASETPQGIVSGYEAMGIQSGTVIYMATLLRLFIMLSL